jgi:pentose-5-phosphate-3-epimerase
MQILPSLLEYTVQSLDTKLKLLQNPIVNTITNHQSLHIHLDVVMKDFAKQRSIMQSLEFDTVHTELMRYYLLQKIELTIHFMGESSDLFELYKTLQSFEFNTNWHYTILVPLSHIVTFKELLKPKNIEVGVWCDLEKWEVHTEAKTLLLMTVKAGLSGQKMTPEIKNKAAKFVVANPNHKFILDGGWNIDDTIDASNAMLVSHTSFWNKLNSCI